MITIYLIIISENNWRRKKAMKQFAKSCETLSDFVFIEIPPLREARNHTNRIDARKKLTPIRYLKAYPRFYYVTNYSGISLNGLNMCAK